MEGAPFIHFSAARLRHAAGADPPRLADRGLSFAAVYGQGCRIGWGGGVSQSINRQAGWRSPTAFQVSRGCKTQVHEKNHGGYLAAIWRQLRLLAAIWRLLQPL